MTRVFIPAVLRKFSGGAAVLTGSGPTVVEAVKSAVRKMDGLYMSLFTETGQMRHTFMTFLHDRQVSSNLASTVAVSAEDVITLVPQLAGGVDLSNGFGVISEERSATTALTNDEILRYSRHLILPEVTLEGQKRLRAAKVLLIGSGGLGSPLALYLAAAGVGTLGLVDFDVVDYTNLQRQIIHGTSDVGRPKIVSATETIHDLNPNVKVIPFEERFTSENAMRIAKDFDIIIDGTDNFPTRYLTNDVSVLLGKPNVYGSIFRFEGQATVFWAEKGPCYRCLYPEPPPPGMVPSCAEGGVLGVLPGIVGCMQAIEAIKLILGIGEPLIGRLLTFNALKMNFREYKLRKDPNCPICGENRTINELIDYEEFCGIRGEEREAVQLSQSEEISVVELKQRMDAGENLVIIDVREPYEYAISRIPGTILIPLGQVSERAAELEQFDEIIIHCRSGIRSADALNILKSKGFKNLKNVVGGIDAWSVEIDPTVPRY